MKQFKFILFIALIGSKSFGYDLWVTNGVVGTDGLPKKITVIPQAVWGIGNSMFGQSRQDVGVKEDVFPDGTKVTYITGAGGIGHKKNGSKYDYLKTIDYGNTTNYAFDEWNMFHNGYVDTGLCFNLGRLLVGVEGSKSTSGVRTTGMGTLMSLPILMIKSDQFESTLNAAREFGDSVQQAAVFAMEVAAAAETGGASTAATQGLSKVAAAGGKPALTRQVSVADLTKAEAKKEVAKSEYKSKLQTGATGFVSASKENPGFFGNMIGSIGNLVKTSSCHDLHIFIANDPERGYIGLVQEGA